MTKNFEGNQDETGDRQIRIYLHSSNLMEDLETLFEQTLLNLLHNNQTEALVLQTWGDI